VAANTTINGVTFQALNIPAAQLTYTSGNYTFTPSFGPLGSGIVGSGVNHYQLRGGPRRPSRAHRINAHRIKTARRRIL
jgi:hypothetical protein